MCYAHYEGRCPKQADQCDKSHATPTKAQLVEYHEYKKAQAQKARSKSPAVAKPKAVPRRQLRPRILLLMRLRPRLKLAGEVNVGAPAGRESRLLLLLPQSQAIWTMSRKWRPPVVGGRPLLHALLNGSRRLVRCCDSLRCRLVRRLRQDGCHLVALMSRSKSLTHAHSRV